MFTFSIPAAWGHAAYIASHAMHSADVGRVTRPGVVRGTL
jgi:hypothetical protein